MRKQTLSTVICSVGLVAWSLVSSTHTAGASANDLLLDVLVWGADPQISAAAYPPGVKAEFEKHLQRSTAYRSTRTPPVNSREMDMVYAAQVRYERRLVAVSADSTARALAVAYVDSLKPCYEWEGFHDCPEREALFAAEYQAAHPEGPFSRYLPLLAAHRWLCTAEAYESEKRPEDAARSRRSYEQLLATARTSTALLVRTAAEELTARGRCFSER